ncbi:MAG TPA: zf-HC2 domain-containing protein [Gemmatimonadales bacterium]|jgi:anti-sigma factor (TIGR02949 family)|nr:zf-HC2 domain-containing protein [Gemmatimonadales bacterium]
MAEPIDCREAKDRLQDYLKRELTPELADEVHQHLVRCRSCFGRARFEEALVQLLESRARRVTCPEELRQRICSLLRAEAERS